MYINKLVYGFIRQTSKVPDQGWINSRWHWYRFPFSMRNTVLWSPFLRAWFTPEDESAMECMMRLPEYEPVDWVTPERGGVFLDIGAYVGPYALLAARLMGPDGKVIAMEPDSSNRRQLARNLALNGVANCKVIPCAAWSRSGRIGWRRGREPVWHGVDVNQNAETVDALTVDDMFVERMLDGVDWIKMDIEGGEIEALRGAQKTLARFRPTLFIEVHETLTELRDLLSSLNYRIEREAFDQLPNRHGWILARAQ